MSTRSAQPDRRKPARDRVLPSRTAGRLRRQVAASVDATPDLVPHFPRLFAGISALGSSPRRVVRALRELGVGPGWLVYDVACGKGSASIELARSVGCRAVGVDACAEFLDAARAEACRWGVEGRTEFMTADVRRFKPRTRADAALMLGLLGFEEAAPLLRRLVKPGGIYVIDDAVGMSRVSLGTAEAPTRADALALFASLGDTLVREHVVQPRDVARMNASIVRRLERNASEVALDLPALKRSLGEFIGRQRRANRVLTTEIRPVVWYVRAEQRQHN